MELQGHPPVTSEGKLAALRALAARREANQGKPPIDNASLHAGSPMYFDCLGCNGMIVVPESYLNRPKLCDECMALKDVGWLD